MRWFLRASDASYRKAIAEEANQGRLPLARFTWGLVTGLGWGFVHPWAQLALFPAKGTLGGVGDPARYHERFFLLRLRPIWRSLRHPNHEHPIAGRYWTGYAWRPRFGYREFRVLGRTWLRIPKPRRVVLDPDVITVDPHQEEYPSFIERLERRDRAGK